MSRAVAVALLGLASLAGCDEPDRSPASPAARVEAPAAPREVAELTPPPAPEVPTPKPPTPADDRAAVVTPPPAPKGPRSHVFGRIVDESGAALADVHLIFDSVDGEWATGVDVPIIDKRYDVQGFEAQSDATGRFEFDVPVPTANWISLMVRPDAYHDLAGRNFGPAGGRNEPRLVAGDNDLGEFKLATTGAISGSVIDTAGNPIGGAEVRLDGSFPGGYGRQCESDASGAFTVEHVPAGSYGVEALHKGHQLAKRADVAVAVNATTPIGAITLATASTISGVVIDELGNPVPGARVWGWPVGSGRGSGARADAQGRFVVALAQTEPHVFQVEAEGFAKYEEQHFGPDSAEHAHAVGANDVRIVMKRPVMTTFVVLDAQTSKPVTKFGVKITFREIETPDGTTRRSGGEPEYEVAEHANGEFECEADPASNGFEITAPGYVPAQGVIAYESASSHRCIVQLHAGAGVVGRVEFDGKPVARASVRVWRESLFRFDQEEGGGAFDEDDYYWDDSESDARDPSDWIGDSEDHETDALGRFEITNLPAGECRFEIVANTGARVVLDPVAIPDGGKDLGDVTLLAGCSLHGTLLIPPGVSPKGIDVVLWGKGHGHNSFDRARKTQVDEQGRFAFDALSAGKQHVSVGEKPGVIGRGPGVTYELAPGESKEVTIDAGDRVGVFVNAVVKVNGTPMRDCSILMQPIDTKKWPQYLPRTDARGAASNWCNAVGKCNVIVKTPMDLPLGVLASRVDLSGSAPIELDLDVPAGRLVIEWPALPGGEPAQFVPIETELTDPIHQSFRGMLFPASDQRGWAHTLSPTRVDCGWLGVGSYDLHITVSPKGSFSHDEVPNYRKALAIRAGETTECVLTEADREQGK